MFHRTSAFNSHLEPKASFTTYPGAVSATLSGICLYSHITVKALAFTVLWFNQPPGHRHYNLYQPFISTETSTRNGYQLQKFNHCSIGHSFWDMFSKSYHSQALAFTILEFKQLPIDSSLQDLFPFLKDYTWKVVTCYHLYQCSTGHYVLDMLNIFISQS
jgi:hypothetical protein